MSKSNRIARQRADRAAAVLRQDAARRQRRTWAGVAIAVVAVVFAVLVIVRVSGGSAEATQNTAAPASAEVLDAVTGVPQSSLDKIGKGTVTSLPQAISGQPALTAGGKPLVVYFGAEYCPFCAAQRWGLVIALSRFGGFSGLRTTASASDDVYPDTATLSFHGATYTSDYLAFQGIETQSNVKQHGSYTTLDTPTAQQQQLLEKYNAPPYVAEASAGSIPFIDFGNQLIASGASISPQLLAGRSAEQIAQALRNPDDPIAKAVLGSANAFTAALCQLTNGQPGSVCSTTAAKAYSGQFGAQ